MMTTQQTGMDVSQIAQVLSQAGCVMEGVRQTRILVLFDHLGFIKTMPLIPLFESLNVEMDSEWDLRNEMMTTQ